MKVFLWSTILWLAFVAVGSVDAQEREKVIKVVRIKWCIVEDRPGPPFMGAHNPPADRFNPFVRLFALLAKNLIWARAGILFAPEGSVTIADPNPPPPDGTGDGARGDILGAGPTGRASAEMRVTRARCDAALPERERQEKIVDILIRRFVLPGGGFTGVLGSTNRFDPSPKPIVNDPASDPPPPPPGLIWPFFGAPLSFTRTLAHEDGHALNLPDDPCAAPHNGHLMQQSNCPAAGFGFDEAEKMRAQARADRYSFTKKKKITGRLIPEVKPITRASIDAEDASKEWIDIVESVATTEPDGGLTLHIELAGLLPDTIAGLKYVFMMDVDNNTATGGSPDVGFAHTFQGADLFAEVTISKTAGAPSVSTVLKRFEAGEFVEVTDPRIVARLETILEAADPLGAFPSQDSVKLALPGDPGGQPLALAEGYRVGPFAFDGVELDEAPIVDGSVTQVIEPPLIMVEPFAVISGTTVTVTGEAFAPFSNVGIFLGRSTDPVATGITDSLGNFQVQFVVPDPTDETFVESLEGQLVSPVTAIDDAENADAMILKFGVCFIDGDGDVDLNDISAIFAARNTSAAPGDRRDADGNGVITVLDARICAQACTRPNCAP